MITGAHVIVYSTDAFARSWAFFRDVLGYPHVDATLAKLAEHGVSCSPPTDEGWGVLTTIRLPGGGDLGLYQPRHERATEL